METYDVVDNRCEDRCALGARRERLAEAADREEVVETLRNVRCVDR